VLGALAVASAAARASGSVERAVDESRFEVLMINGGGQRFQNYQSHLLHLRELFDLLLASGLSSDQVSLFSADGPDPAPDLAVRDQSVLDAWMIDGTGLGRSLDPRTRYVNSSLDGADLKPATKAALRKWFATASERLRPGDTLLLYVTDHGTKNPEDTTDNQITLWGKGENLSVSELRALIAQLDAGVHVVTLMSQCYSGAFANLMYGQPERVEPRANICGYFSSTAQRPAYGCYPENYGKENVGHSFRFIDALRGGSSFPNAHRQVLVTDQTPDVPLKTSDVYLRTILEQAAAGRDLTLNRLVDQLLLAAWADKAAWEPEIRLLDRIGQSFGFFSPRLLEEIEERTDRLPEASRQFSRYGEAWQAALQSLNAEILDDFLEADADWSQRVSGDALKGLTEQDRQALARELLPELSAYARSATASAERLDLLKQRAESSRGAHYRMQVRLAALLRMKSVLTRIAGQVYLANHGSRNEADIYASLVECEALTLSASETAPGPATDPAPFPSYEDDLALAKEVLPGWMGIRFRPTDAELRAEKGLEAGATDVLTVYPDSPASEAGIEIGDIILGPPGDPFVEQRQIREWIMTIPIGEPQPLLILRDDDELRVSLSPGSYPIDLPALPGPPEVGSVAPPLEKLVAYRGTLPATLTNDGGYLLFFWATWCGPCKQAVPEILAFERERGTKVIAITDERSAQLEPFFETRDSPFPRVVATDRRRLSFQAYGVSGTPSFVLIGADGTVQSTSTGYSREKGLGVLGWSWPKVSPPEPDGATGR
jgi:thiol-disulfide isomerase/thioredoxin